MRFELIYQEIGELGLYAKYILGVGCLSSTYAGLLFISSFFVLAIPNHRCALPNWDNDTFDVQDDRHFETINRTIPSANSEDYDYDQCHYRRWTGEEYVLQKCDHWVYDKSVFKSSLAADMNMVCDRAILKSNAQMFFFGGLLTGSLLTGLFSDRFGRKTTVCLSSIFYFLAAMGIAWTPSYAVYVALNFSVGFFAVGNFMPVFVTGMEFVGPSKRRIAGTIGGYYWAVGNLCLAGLAYAIRDWKTLQIVCAAPGILFQLFWLWLIGRRRQEEAKKIIRKAGKWGKVEIPDKFFDDIFGKDDEPIRGNILHVFKYRALFIRTCVVYLNWCVVCLAYYGLALNSGDLVGDIHLNFMIQSFMDLPATTVTLLLLDRLGRKFLLVGSFLLSGISCLSTVLTITYAGPEYAVSTTILAMIGKFGASAAFSLVYIHTGELYPTIVRNSAMGTSSMMARVGGMIAPYIADLDRLVGGPFGKALPQVVFGSLSILSGLLALTLPETLNRNLPETIEQCMTLDVDISIDHKKRDKNDESHINEAFDNKEVNTKL